MSLLFNRISRFVVVSGTCLLWVSCTRKDIQFGDTPENGYTHLAYIDTVGIRLSTVITDSFATNGAASFLAGRYTDPHLGVVSARSFFQMTIPPAVTDIPSTAVFDSLTFILHPNNYYYGDTGRVQTLYLEELSAPITYGYNNKLYNTSSVPVKPAPLGAVPLRIRPNGDDTLELRISDAKGLELFTKLRQQSTDVTNSDNFQNYFRGISLRTGINDTTAIFGFTGSMILRVHYHLTIPYPQKKHIDFNSLANDFAFNQILSQRNGTGLVSGGNNLTEIAATQTNGLAFLQPGTGLNLKVTFPSLQGILASDKIVKLLKAELLIRPTPGSFDLNKYKVPGQLYLVQTDASNVEGATVVDSTGNNVQYAPAILDDVYGQNNYYRFNITPYINQWLSATRLSNNGFFVKTAVSAASPNVNRLVVNTPEQGAKSPQLLLYVVAIDK